MEANLEYIRNILEPNWDYWILLELYLGPIWNSIGILLQSIRILLDSYWKSYWDLVEASGILLGFYSNPIGILLEFYENSIGSLLELIGICWNPIGTLLQWPTCGRPWLAMANQVAAGQG